MRKANVRVEQLSKLREKRRYPFNSSTKLIDLVDKKHYGDIVWLDCRFRPYLIDGERGVFELTRLYFDIEKIWMKRQFVIEELAILLLKMIRENGLTCSQSVFIRYFSCPEHCNLGISEKSLKVLILDAKRRNS